MLTRRSAPSCSVIVEIKWTDEWKDSPVGADIGGPDVQDLWVMDSFAFALSEGIWPRQSNANTTLRNIKTKDYASRTEIVIKQPLVSLVNFLYDKNDIVLFVPAFWPKCRYKI